MKLWKSSNIPHTFRELNKFGFNNKFKRESIVEEPRATQRTQNVGKLMKTAINSPTIPLHDVKALACLIFGNLLNELFARQIENAKRE